MMANSETKTHYDCVIMLSFCPELRIQFYLHSLRVDTDSDWLVRAHLDIFPPPPLAPAFRSTFQFTNHSARKTVVSKLNKANVERSGIVKVTGHKNIQSLDDYDEANENEQRQLSYAISGRNNINPQPPISREVHISQEPLASSAQKPISMPNSAAFGLNQSSTSLNPTMMRAQIC